MIDVMLRVIWRPYPHVDHRGNAVELTTIIRQRRKGYNDHVSASLYYELPATDA